MTVHIPTTHTHTHTHHSVLEDLCELIVDHDSVRCLLPVVRHVVDIPQDGLHQLRGTPHLVLWVEGGAWVTSAGHIDTSTIKSIDIIMGEKGIKKKERGRKWESFTSTTLV